MDSLKLRKVGNSVVVTIPVDVLERYELKEGDTLRLDREAERIVLRPERASVIVSAERMMTKYEGVLKRLAK